MSATEQSRKRVFAVLREKQGSSRLRLIVALPVLLFVPFTLQAGSRRGSPPLATVTPALPVNTQATTNIDSAFLKKMAQASLGAIEMGHLGASNAQSSQLCDLGHKLVQEHHKLLRRIQHTAHSTGTTLPQAPGLKDVLAEQQLRQTGGRKFDKTLAKQLLADNAESLEDLRDATNKLQRTQVKKLASHLEEKLETEMQDIRDAAKSAGISEGTILSEIQEHQSAARPAESSGAEKIQPIFGTPEAVQPQSKPEKSEAQGAPTVPPFGFEPPEQGFASRPKAPSLGAKLDNAFLRRLAQASASENEIGRLGLSQSQNEQLIDLSRQLVLDHSQTEAHLTSLAQRLGFSIPKQPGLEDQLARRQLQQQSGTNFDQALTARILSDEARLLQETENVRNKLQDKQVKQLATETAKRLRQNLEQAKMVARDVGLKPRKIEQTIITQLMAAGAPYPLVAGVESHNSQPKPKADKSGKGSSRSPGGNAIGKGSGQTSTWQEAGSSSNAVSHTNNVAPSPLELQQDRAHHNPKPNRGNS